MKRIAKTTATTTISEATQFQPLFRDLVEGAIYAYVDPFACIPFIKVLQTSDCGVKKLIELYDRTSSQYDHNKLKDLLFVLINPLHCYFHRITF